jgi:hypothetical protein
MAINQKRLPDPAYLAKLGVEPEDVKPDQKTLTPASVDLSGRQRPNPDANNEVFQPWAGQRPNDGIGMVPADRSARIVGNMATGMPQDGYAAQSIPVDLGADMATGGEPDGPKSGNEAGAQNFYRSIKDLPGGQGSGSAPLNPGGQTGT